MGTRLELYTRIVGGAFKRTDKTTQVYQAINDTLLEMAGCIQNRKTTDQRWVPTVDEQEDYAMPDDTLRLNHPIRLIDPSASSASGSSYPMTFLSKERYDVLEPAPNAATKDTGKPTHYTVWKNCILLYPIPDAVYRLEINVGGELVTLQADGDISIFLDRWDETIAAGANSRLFYDLELYDEGDKWRNVFINGHGGQDGRFSGGLKLLQELEHAVTRAPQFVAHNDF